MPDPYKVWLSEVMLQQTTVATVGPYFEYFLAEWPDVIALSKAKDADVMAAWAGLGYYARARNLLKCARVVAGELGGKFPENYTELLKLPGIGPYTAAAVAAIAFDQPETVVDGNVERVVSRLFDISTPLPGAKKELHELASQLTPHMRAGNHAQAMMDLGATICRTGQPHCGRCPIAEHCLACVAGRAANLPQRTAKAPKPTRFGIAYVARRGDGAWLLERRPDKGLLGGMLGWPGSDWAVDAEPDWEPPAAGTWHEVAGEVRHTFTHFHLRIRVFTCTLDLGQLPERLEVIPEDRFDPGDLPTVMRKVFVLVRHEPTLAAHSVDRNPSQPYTAPRAIKAG